MLTGIFEIDTATYEDMIIHTTQSNGNLLVLGQAGIGKTEIPFQVAKKLGLETVYWNLSTQEVPDLVGLPMIDETLEVPRVTYAAPYYLPVKELVKKPVMVIIDELDKAKPDLQNPLLEILHGHTLNGRELSIKCIVATGNLPDENAHSKSISHALTNRCKVFKLRHNLEAWSDWAVNKGVNALIVAFINKNPEYLSMPPVQGDPTAYTRCSPRAWTNAAKDIDIYNNSKDIEFQTLLVAGRVGSAAAAKFRVWLDHYRHVEHVVDAIIKDGKMPNLGNFTIDRVLVTAISCTGQLARMVSSNDAKEKVVSKTAVNVFKFLKLLPPEVQIAAVKSSISNEMTRKYNLWKIPEVMDVYNNLFKALDLG